MPTPHEKVRAFAERHRGPGMIVLPNAWDPGSAIAFAMSNAEANALMRAARRDG